MRTVPFGLLCSLILLAGPPRSARGEQAPAANKDPGVGYHRGDIAPALTLMDQHDQPVSLTDFRGRDVLMVFSAAWCGPCMEAAAISDELVRTLNQKGRPTALVEVLVENIDGSPSETIDAVDWAEQFNLSGPVLHTSGDPISPAIQQLREYGRSAGKTAYPMVVLLSPHGRIVSIYAGFSRTAIETDFLDQPATNERISVDWLLTRVERMDIESGLKPAVTAPLQAVLTALDRGGRQTACQQMAVFTEQVRIQSGQGIQANVANGLLATARAIQGKLPCG